MEGYSMYFPCYTIGHGVYEKIGKVCRDYGTSAVIIGGGITGLELAWELKKAGMPMPDGILTVEEFTEAWKKCQ